MYGAHLLHVPGQWIAVGGIVLVGVGLLSAVKSTRQRDPSAFPVPHSRENWEMLPSPGIATLFSVRCAVSSRAMPVVWLLNIFGVIHSMSRIHVGMGRLENLDRRKEPVIFTCPATKSFNPA